jgi:hypothetical protein
MLSTRAPRLTRASAVFKYPNARAVISGDPHSSRAARFDGCAKIQQRLDQRDLHAGVGG